MGQLNIRAACDGDERLVWNIMETVGGDINNEDIFIADDLPFIENHISKNGFTLLCEADNCAAGFLIIRIPESAEDNLGFDIGLNQSEAARTAHIESLAVLKEYRGRHIQRMLISEAEAILLKKGFIYFMATVSPSNSYSLNNFLALKYKIMTTKLKYNNNIRHILLKKAACSTG